MAKNLFARYIWIIDTILRHKKITRERLNDLWERSEFAADSPTLPRRTFYNYRNAIYEIFGLNIECNPSTFEYYIAGDDGQRGNVTDWMLSTAAMTNTLTDARDISERIFFEDVPSSREFLSQVITAMKEFRVLEFRYQPFVRSGRPKPVTLEPFFLKIFRQRWYITGRNVREGKIKTYALDRMSNVEISRETFEMPPDFDAETYFRDAFGIVFSQGEAKKVTIRTDTSQANYFKTLPLHHSQEEMFCDGGSIFTYRVRLTPDFVQELLSYGPKVTVLGPPELKAMMLDNLNKTLKNYQE